MHRLGKVIVHLFLFDCLERVEGPGHVVQGRHIA